MVLLTDFGCIVLLELDRGSFMNGFGRSYRARWLFLLVGICLVLQLPKADLCWWDGAGLRFCFIMGRACLINSAGVCGVLS